MIAEGLGDGAGAGGDEDGCEGVSEGVGVGEGVCMVVIVVVTMCPFVSHRHHCRFSSQDSILLVSRICPSSPWRQQCYLHVTYNLHINMTFSTFILYF